MRRSQSLVMRMIRTSLPASSAESQNEGESEDMGGRSSTSTLSPDDSAVSFPAESQLYGRTARGDEELEGGRVADGR